MAKKSNYKCPGNMETEAKKPLAEIQILEKGIKKRRLII
jgi:hypothetical protein